MTGSTDTSGTSPLPELTVSELAHKLKRTVEAGFGHVRVRGELGRVTVARSGHIYADLKDEQSVLNMVMWKGQAGQLTFRPEQGLEVIAAGRLSIYPDRSSYQLIANDILPAGAGALMALLEKRKQQLAEQGLFDTCHKKPLPFLPDTIGVVTSPTGAVIRDILHRISARFPVRVIVWPTLVQGNMAAEQITAAIRGFNAMDTRSRPDVLIVARGGGSLEDLWPFNEETVLRAAFDSVVPLISAIGHETDTTLLDHVCDVRAPTPTGAAEIAVPVRSDLIEKTDMFAQRLEQASSCRMQQIHDRLLVARLPQPERWLNYRHQRFDMAAERLPRALAMIAGSARARLNKSRLCDLNHILAGTRLKLDAGASRLTNALRATINRHVVRLTATGSQFRIQSIRRKTRRAHESLDTASRQLPLALAQAGARKRHMFDTESRLLETLSHHATVRRGYAIVRARNGSVVNSCHIAVRHHTLNLELGDGAITIRPVRTKMTHSQPSTGKTEVKAQQQKHGTTHSGTSRQGWLL